MVDEKNPKKIQNFKIFQIKNAYFLWVTLITHKNWYVQHFLWFYSEIDIFDLKVRKATKIVKNHVILHFDYLYIKT